MRTKRGRGRCADHVYDGGDPESGGGGTSIVFLYDLKSNHLTGQAYTYTNTAEDGEAGTLISTEIEDFDRVDNAGNITPGLVSTLITVDLVTGESTTLHSSNIPESNPPTPEETSFEPGSMWRGGR